MTGDLPIFTIEQQIACLKRELAVREACYPKWVLAKKLLQAKADHELGAMKAALHTLMSIKENPNA